MSLLWFVILNGMVETNTTCLRSISTSRPVLAGNSKSDWMFWQLSSVLAEIAEQSIREKTEFRDSASPIDKQKDVRQSITDELGEDDA